jgi:NAD(P)-dependent dehydrogenase (short-subunit alcohol dehydrogenase family)
MHGAMAERDRLALVTGGGRGIGAAVARALAKAGWRVVVTGRSEDQIRAVATEIGGEARRADLSNAADTAALVAEVRALGDLGLLVNNAGIAESAPLEKVSDQDWGRMMTVNATAPFRLCRAFVPGMIERGWGRVVNIASNAGLTGYGYSTAYCASKHAVIGMTRAMAIDLARTGVTINAVCPGWVDTQMAAEAVARIAAKTGRDAETAKSSLVGMTPQRRMIQPEEVAHCVLMLVDDNARGIHGQTIVVDGGQVMK